MLANTAIEILELHRRRVLPDEGLRLLHRHVALEALLLDHDLQNLRQLRGRVVGEEKLIRDTSLDSWIQECPLFHFRRVARDNNHVPLNRHCSHKTVHSLLTELICAQTVSLVDKQHSARCVINELLSLLLCLTKGSSNHLVSLNLHELVLPNNLDLVQQFGYNAPNGCLTNTRISLEHQHYCLIRMYIKTSLPAQTVEPDTPIE
mmetsp:Transcript_140897/g.245330  ORF Transcript_140897/g.245330 Transcript_140897/m.245330 type:complete len:205 (+) Transcript_140897:254-868(+)